MEAVIPKGKQFITVAEMQDLCPDCAHYMKRMGMEKISVAELSVAKKAEPAKQEKQEEADPKKEALIKKAVSAWESMPKGWNMDSIKSFWKSLTGDHKHKRKACMKEMKGKVSSPGAFCNSIYDMLKD